MDHGELNAVGSEYPPLGNAVCEKLHPLMRAQSVERTATVNPLVPFVIHKIRSDIRPLCLSAQATDIQLTSCSSV
ncbi:hypothetical protein QOT17_023013 [Balamuthia mandrillaris]